jgi:transcriptional regulator with XRE-family HTH domain
MSATDRVRQRLQGLVREKKLPQSIVAGKLGIARSAVNRYVHGPTPITIDFLEVAEEVSGVPLGELASPQESWKQVNPDEAALLRALRRWPITVTRALGAFVAFFADEPAQVRQTRNFHELWRHLPQKKRDELYAIGVLLSGGTLAPDLLARLMAQLEAEQKSYAAAIEE